MPGVILTNAFTTYYLTGLVETDFQYRMWSDPESAKNIQYGNLRCLQPEDIGESVVYALSVPPHVQITELMIESTDPYP